MLEVVGGAQQTDEEMCRGRGWGGTKQGIDRKGYKQGWLHVKRGQSVLLSD